MLFSQTPLSISRLPCPPSGPVLSCRTMMRKVIHETVWLLLIAAILAAGAYALRPDILPLKATDPPVKVSEEPFKEISLDAAREMFAKGTALFADARPAVAYEAGHIRKALNLEPAALDEWAPTLIANYALDQPIVAYCEGAQCQLSRELAERLTWLGYEKVYYLGDGWGQWQKHGLPVDLP